MDERQDPDNSPSFPTQEMCAMALAAYVFTGTLYTKGQETLY